MVEAVDKLRAHTLAGPAHEALHVRGDETVRGIQTMGTQSIVVLEKIYGPVQERGFRTLVLREELTGTDHARWELVNESFVPSPAAIAEKALIEAERARVAAEHVARYGNRSPMTTLLPEVLTIWAYEAWLMPDDNAETGELVCTFTQAFREKAIALGIQNGWVIRRKTTNRQQPTVIQYDPVNRYELCEDCCTGVAEGDLVTISKETGEVTESPICRPCAENVWHEQMENITQYPKLITDQRGRNIERAIRRARTQGSNS